jgi:hypothetical protein
MIGHVHVVPSGRPAGQALASAIRAAKGAAALAPVTAIVPSNFAGLAARRLLVTGELRPADADTSAPVGVANVSFLTPFGLAELLAADQLLDRHPLTNPVLGAAIRLTLRDDPGPFARVRDHIATETALAALYAELSNVSEPALQRLESEGGRAARIAAGFQRSIAARLAEFHDEADMAHAAASRHDLEAALAPFGHLIWYLPAPTTAPIAEFLRAVLHTADATVVVGVTGDLGADAAVWRTCVRAGLSIPDPRPVVETPTASRIISVTDADEEVRAVVREIVTLAEAGMPLDRIGVFHPTPTPYVGILRQQLAAAGIPSNGPSTLTVRDTAAGRTLLAALALPAQRWRRDRVMALVSGAPVRHDGELARPAAWETISREAGVVHDLGDWRRRLEVHRSSLQRHLDQPLPGSTVNIEHTAAAIDETRALASFVEHLADAVTAVETATGWAAKSSAGLALLSQLLGDDRQHGQWPESERAAFERVEDALSRLGALDHLEPRPTAAVFARALAAELDVTQGRVGRFGDGVLYGPLASAAGLDLDAVFLVGCTEGLCPAARRDDALLPDAARVLTDGELELRAARIDDQHRQFLVALATAPPEGRVLTIARGDLRGSRRSLPSRWLLDTASALAGNVVHSTEFDRLPPSVVTVVPSHATGVVTAPVHASLADRDLAAMSRLSAQGVDVTDHPTMAKVHRGVWAQILRRSDRFTEWDGNLAHQRVRSPGADPWSPSRLQAWASCGYRYFLGYQLGLSERDEPERVLDLGPLDRGSGVHEVLERFLTEVIEHGPPAPGERWSAQHRERLREIAADVFDQYERRGRTGRPVHWALTRADLLDTLDAFLVADDTHRAATGSRPDRVEYPFGLKGNEPATIRLANGRTLSFRGMADRIDRSDTGRVLVSDYKTGKGAQYKGLGADGDDPVRGGTLLQLGIYAEAALQQLDATEADAHYWMINGDVAFARFGYRWTPERRQRLIDVVTTIVDGIDAGVFPAVPGEWNNFRNTHENCTYCEFDRVCSRDRGEHAEAKVGAPELRIRERLLPEAP